MADFPVDILICNNLFSSIPTTGSSINPARSIGPAIFAGGKALSQLWLFIIAPVLGGLLAAGIWKFCLKSKSKKV